MKKSESTTSINNYRPPSFSEGYIYEYKKLNNSASKDLLETLIDNSNLITPITSISKNSSTESLSSLSKNSNKNNSDLESSLETNTDSKIDNDIVKIYAVNNLYSINNTVNQTIPTLPLVNADISQNENKLYLRCIRKKVLLYIYKRLLNFITHLTLISLFELIFFFAYISVYEDTALVSLVGSFTGNIPGQCSALNTPDKEIFTYFFNLFINTTNVDNNANLSLSSRTVYNSALLIKSWIYFGVILGLNLILILIKFIYKIKVSLLKITTDNILMVIILGLYEYLFFSTVILKYQSISPPELTRNIVNSFDNCLV